MYLCAITCDTITRELNVAETCGLNHFVAIVTVQVTYISDFTFCPRKPKYSTTSGDVLKITCTTITRELNVVETCGLDHSVANVTVQKTYISDLTFCPRKLQHCATSGYVCIALSHAPL